MLGRALKMTFWVLYDHLGKLLLANLFWSLVLCVPGGIGVTAFLSGDRGVQLVLGVPMTALSLGIVLPICSAGIAHMAKVLIEKRDGSLRDMFSGMRLYGLRAAGLGIVYLVLATGLATSTWFYAGVLRDSLPWLGYGLSAVALWGLVFLGLSALLVMPALVQKKAGVAATLKLAGLLVLANPVLSVGLAVQVLALTAIVVVVWPLFFFLYGSAVIVLLSSAYEMLARKYAATARGLAADFMHHSERGAAVGPDKTGTPSDEEDDYLNRGLRDFLFPWKG